MATNDSAEFGAPRAVGTMKGRGASAARLGAVA